MFKGRARDRDLGTGRMLGYAVGHFFNDLCASMWFTYLMIYLENVIQMHSYKAGMLMLIGQVGLREKLVDYRNFR
jgi:Na+/melibiose symporter-like transporter